MKKFILAICLIMDIAAIRAVQGDEKNVNQEVVLQEKSKVFRPRNVVLLPICWYHGFNCSVVIEFPDDDVSFTAMVINTSTGEQWFEMNDNGYCEVFISGETGTYTVSIDTVSGNSYEGDFSLL